MSPFGLTKCVAVNPVGLISQSTVSPMKLFTYLGQVHKMISLEEIVWSINLEVFRVQEYLRTANDSLLMFWIEEMVWLIDSKEVSGTQKTAKIFSYSAINLEWAAVNGMKLL